MSSTRKTTSEFGTPLGRQLMRRKSIAAMTQDATNNAGLGSLKRTFGVLQLVMISVGATLGTGILVILGDAVPKAGPATWIAFVLAGLTALLCAVSYAEMAGMVPVSGSSYSYSYVTLGEGIAWICGWCLVLEYAVSAAAVAVGAGAYVNQTLEIFGLSLPEALSTGLADRGLINLPALIVVALATFLLVRGARDSAVANTVMVIIKIAILVFFVIVAFTVFDSGNFEPLLPMGIAGVSGAASMVFFSYIGFDAASTAGEEAKNPQRDLPRAILIAMALVTVIYVLVAVAALGARNWEWFANSEAALVQIVSEITGQPWLALVFALASVIAIVSVVLTVLYGQTRILLSMARDGLVPRFFGRVSTSTGTPVIGTLVTGSVVAVTAALIPLGQLAEATSIGTLFAFALVGFCVIYLRRTQPEAPRTFRVPLYPAVPLLGIAACLYLMFNLAAVTWLVFGLWMLVGAAIYLAYGRRHSRLGTLTEIDYKAGLNLK